MIEVLVIEVLGVEGMGVEGMEHVAADPAESCSIPHLKRLSEYSSWLTIEAFLKPCFEGASFGLQGLGQPFVIALSPGARVKSFAACMSDRCEAELADFPLHLPESVVFLQSYLPNICCLSLVVTFLISLANSSDAGYPNAEPPPAVWKAGFNSIDEEESKELLSILVGDGFDGRGTGQEGYVRAAHFVAGKLAEYGFQPIGDNGSYFQNLPYTQSSPDVEASFILLNDGSRIRGADDLGFVRVPGTAQLSARTVLLSGKTTGVRLIPERAKVKDRIVIVHGDGYDRRLESILLRAGAVASLFVTTEKPRNSSELTFGDRRSFGNIVSGSISKGAAEKILADIGLELPESREGLTLTTSDSELTIDVKVVSREALVPNVVGWLPGTDPDVNHEHIIIGAHLDHLGRNSRGLFPGADDNGSGSVALLQIAKALHESPEKPRRSVLYIAFAAEEVGLRGSKYYADHPLKPLSDAVCMLNIDMIGRNEEHGNETADENEYSIHLVASQKLSEDLHLMTLEANRHVAFEFEYDEENRVFARSDQKSFFDKGIPVTFLFGGFNPFYHQVTDTLDGINYSKIANAARLNYLVIMMASEHGPFAKDQ